MKLFINSSSSEEVSKEKIEKIFEGLLSEFETIHSISMSIERKVDHYRRELERAREPIDPEDPHFKELINKIQK